MLQHEFSTRLGCEVVSGTESIDTWREQVDTASRGVVLLQTKSVLAHPVRLLQLFEATNHGYPLVCVNVVGGGYDFGKVKPFLESLATELPNFATLRDELQKSNLSVGKLVRSLSKAVPNAISVFFNPGGTDIAQDAAVRDVIDKLRVASIAADALRGAHQEEEAKQGTQQNLLAGLDGKIKGLDDGVSPLRAATRELGAAASVAVENAAAVCIQKMERARRVRSRLTRRSIREYSNRARSRWGSLGPKLPKEGDAGGTSQGEIASSEIEIAEVATSEGELEEESIGAKLMQQTPLRSRIRAAAEAAAEAKPVS